MILASISTFGLAAGADPAHKYALFLGGSGDSAGDTTVFDQDLSLFANKIKSAGYDQASVLFDGNHATSKRIARAIDPNAQSFRPEKVQAKIEQLSRQIDQDMKPGDQLLVVVDTHGARKRAAESSEKGHKVETEDPDNPFDVKALAQLQARAKAKGVRLAIMDMSCYSGNTLDLADGNTCVIAASSADSVAFSDFAPNLFSKLQKDRSLEDSFLKARLATPYGQPKISTQADQIANAALQSVESNVRFDINDLQCTDDPSAIQSQTHQIMQALTLQFGMRPDDLPKLKESLLKYLRLRNRLQKDNRFLQQTAVAQGNHPIKYGNLLALESDMDSARQYLATTTDPNIKKILQNALKNEAALKKLKQHLIQTNPEFARIVAENKKAGGSGTPEEQLEKAASEVNEYERSAYSMAYDKESTRLAGQGESNPCQDFKF